MNRTEVEADFRQWERGMRWTEFWHEEEEDSAEDEDNWDRSEQIFQNRSKKTNLPRNHSVPQSLMSCIMATKYDVLGSSLRKVRTNIAPELRAAGQDLVTLQRERVIVVKPSDKTGGVCVLDFEDYKTAMDDKLQEKFLDINGEEKLKYVKTTEKDLKSQWTAVKTIVDEGVRAGYIGDEDATTMVPEKPKPGRLYGVVKDHKRVVEGSNIPPLREVVSGSGSNTEYLSAYVDHHSKAEVQKLPSYLEDTPHVLRKIREKNRRGPLPPGCIPVTMDVSALYPSVPQDEGLASLNKALEKRVDKSVSTDYLVRMMKIVLTMNTFEWDRNLYRQVSGTAIGTRAAPTFCGLFMGDLEEKLLTKIDQKKQTCQETILCHNL